ncbi:MAG: hypothetical protein KBT29_08780, partial [Prevotellaceae bacterium]|nr:hypothetical protein [Candidatus Minthosoma caballi]
AGLLFACWTSIYSDIAFDEEKAAREKAVIARLMQIRDAEEQYKMTFVSTVVQSTQSSIS